MIEDTEFPKGLLMSPTSDPLHRTTVDSPVGSLTIFVSDTGVRAVLWPDDDAARVADIENVECGGAASSPSPTARMTASMATDQLEEYFAGTRTEFDVPLDPVGTDFQLSAWRALREIPYGETRSYGEQAEWMGDKNKARAVGAANGRNPISIIVPCHRVVGSDGSLTGFAGGIAAKQLLLDLERRVSGRSLL